MSNKKGGFIRKIKKLYSQLNKLSKSNKEKKQRRKQEIRGSIRPKGFIARKFGVIIFWSLFSFMLLVVLVTMFSRDSGEASTEPVLVEKNYATSPEGIQFAENFAKEYFTWEVSDEGKHKRQEIMNKYLADGLDQYAGLNFQGLQWNSNFKSSEVKEVIEISDNVSQITLKVIAEFKKVDSDDVKRVEKYLVVPVAYDGVTFGVYELPKFTYIQEETTLKKVVSNRLNNADSEISSKIREFLPTFFTSFASDTKDKLNYLLTKESVTDGLQGTMDFQEVKEINVFEGEQAGSYVVFAKAIFLEPQTKVSLVTDYQLSVVKRDDRFIVSGINDQKNKEIQSNIVTEGTSNDTESKIDSNQDELTEAKENDK